MTGLEALQAAQHVTVENRKYVIIEADDWEALIEWLETLEDLQVFQQATADLQAAGGDPVKAGWPRWEDIRGELA